MTTNTTNTRTPNTMRGPWGCKYRVDENTVVVNVAQAIAERIVAVAGPHRTSVVNARANVTVEACQAAWAIHADVHREIVAIADTRCSIFGFWVRRIDNTPLNDVEWERVVWLLRKHVEWEATLEGHAPLADLPDGQIVA